MIRLDQVRTVRSRSVRWIGFSKAEGAVFVEFKGERVYRYDGDEALFQQLAQAPSKGAFINRVLVERGNRVDRTQIAGLP